MVLPLRMLPVLEVMIEQVAVLLESDQMTPTQIALETQAVRQARKFTGVVMRL